MLQDGSVLRCEILEVRNLWNGETMARTKPDVLEPVTLRGLLRLERERRIAQPLLAALDRGERSWADFSHSERRLLAGAPMIDHILQESFALRYRDPQEMVLLADRARQLAEGLPTRRYGARVLADLRARAWSELGNAWRVADQLPKAQEAMAAAARWARKGTLDLQLAARLADLAASLAADLGRFAEALELLDDVCSIYHRLGDRHMVGRALISQANICSRNAEPEMAIERLTEGLWRIDPLRDLRLEQNALQSRAVMFTNAGMYEAARACLCDPRLRRPRERLNKLRRFWLEGKISAGLGEYGRAEASFNVARQGFRRDEKYFDAALVSLDLALMLLKQGRRRELNWLVDQMISTFRSLGIAREAIASLLLLQRNCKASTVSLEVMAAQVEMVAAVVAELQRFGSRQG